MDTKSFPVCTVETFAQVVLDWLAAGGDPNFINPAAGGTLLHVAAELQDGKSIERLVNAGANISIQDKSGATPLHVALDSELDAVWQVGQALTFEVTKLLLKFGADPTIPDANGKTPFDWADNYGARQKFNGLLK